VTGTASSVRLVGSDGRTFSPGEVPTGTYRLDASFGADGEQSIGEITVEPGATVRVDCDVRFTRCTVGGTPR
jgi:hypothetical protein